ncbi:MAG: hypothetical protein IPJ67_01090 [Candidatus Moraniibacteriota bacterium]|nr:MAG: hypothetical protein IPJ67_01090 [Candidatus Moranbacteria bacterium]
MNPLKTNGLIIQSFPQEKYESIHLILSSRYAEKNEYEHFSGAWNAIAYRYRGAIDYGSDFVKLIKLYGTAPQPEKRYLQEQALFNHFSSCFSVFESVCYGFFAIGSIINPEYFSISDKADQRKISPETTKKTFQKAFPDEQITKTLIELTADSEFENIRNTRNILIHRTAPGRKIYLHIGEDESLPTEWKLNNKPLNELIVKSNEDSMEMLLNNLLTAGEVFCRSHL